MESKAAIDLLIEFAESYELSRANVDLDRMELLATDLVAHTRTILKALLGREPTEKEIEEVLPV